MSIEAPACLHTGSWSLSKRNANLHNLSDSEKARQSRHRLFFLRSVVGIEQPLADCQFSSRQGVELRRAVGFLQNRKAFGILMHRQQNFLQASGPIGGQISSYRDQVARQTGGFSKYRDRRFLAGVESGIIIAAKSARGDLSREHQVDNFFRRLGKM